MTEEENQKNRELASKWLKEIGRRRSIEKQWRTQATEVVKRYRDERDVEPANTSKYNIQWANVEVLKPAVFARMPVPDVRRRYLTQDPAARTAAMLLERMLSYSIESYDFKDVLDRSLEDYLVPGRGESIVCYKPYLKKTKLRAPFPDSTDESKLEKDEQGPYTVREDKVYEEVYGEYVEWDLFVFGEAKSWAKVPWIATGEYMSKEDVEDEFPAFKDIEKLVFARTSNDVAIDDEEKQKPNKVLVWRLWHKASRKYICLCDGYKEAPLMVMDDPLGLENFYPVPEPLYSIRTNKSWLPKSEYLMYQDQARELDIITNRLKNLIQACKNRGIYDKAIDAASENTISTLMTSPDNTYIGVPGYSSIAEKGGLEALLDSLPLEQIVATIQQLRERMIELKQEIYEIYGISDIVRGQTRPDETLGAQELKAQYAGQRISTRQERFSRYIRDILRIKAEIMAEHFSPETIKVMVGVEVISDEIYAQLKQQQSLQTNMVSMSEFMGAIKIIKSDKLRGFKVDIETDSTIEVNRDQEQQNRVAFMGAIGQYLQGVLPGVQEGMIPIKVAREGLLFVVRGFKVGTELEEVLEEMGENENEAEQLAQMKKMLAQNQEQMQAMQEELGKAQKENQALQSRSEVELKKATDKAMIDQQVAEQQAALEQQKAIQQAELEAQRAEHDAVLKAQAADQDARLKREAAEQDQLLAERKAEFEMNLKAREAELQNTLAIEQAANKADIDQRNAATKEREAESKGNDAKEIKDTLAKLSKPQKRVGKATLPNGKVIEMTMETLQ